MEIRNTLGSWAECVLILFDNWTFLFNGECPIFIPDTLINIRTLQQNLVKTIVAIIRMVGSENYGTDLRNRASHELCKRIVESGLLDDTHLPFI